MLAKLPEEEQIYIMDCYKRAGPGGLLLAFLPSRSTRKAFSRRTGLRHAFSDSDPAAKAVRQRKEAEKEEVTALAAAEEEAAAALSAAAAAATALRWRRRRSQLVARILACVSRLLLRHLPHHRARCGAG